MSSTDCFIRGNGSNGTKNSAKVFSFVDSSDSSRVKSDRGHHHRGVAPEGTTRTATDRPVKDCKHPLYRCSGRTYLGNRLSPSRYDTIAQISSESLDDVTTCRGSTSRKLLLRTSRPSVKNNRSWTSLVARRNLASRTKEEGRSAVHYERDFLSAQGWHHLTCFRRRKQRFNQRPTPTRTSLD